MTCCKVRQSEGSRDHRGRSITALHALGPRKRITALSDRERPFAYDGFSLPHAKSFHVPGTPLRSCSPRTSNSMPDPTTRSFTVDETNTSRGDECASTRAAI